MKTHIVFLIVGLLVVSGGIAWGWQHLSEDKIDFNADIRPILNTRCISCHGGVKESAKFSLFSREDALKPSASGKPSLVPGNPEASELFTRLTLTDPDERMPYHGEPLPAADIEKIRKWIAQGANWAVHWSYNPPVKPALPEDKTAWATTDIDRFVLQKMTAQHLHPSPPASKATLLRRLSLDLTGLPPTETQVADFQKDNSSNAYEKQVNRLLASPHFGERWAALWLDLARYSDSKGYEKDAPRHMWRFRDYVIESFNEDKPFSQFTIEQLAGDLLPQPTENQLIATAYHRNTANNDEGGTEDEEFRTAALLDRVTNTWETWQGITMGCVQCHSHPYDPIRHDEFYKSLAFFNNTRDEDVPGEYPNFIKYNPADEARLTELIGWMSRQVPENERNTKAHELEKLLRIAEPKLHPHAFDSLTNAALIDGKYLGGGHRGMARLKQINLSGKRQVLLCESTDQAGGWLEIHADAPNGRLLTRHVISKEVQNVGFRKVLAPVQVTEGVHDLYFVFYNPAFKNPQDYVVSVEWLLLLPDFPGTGTPGFRATQDTLLALLNRLKTEKTPVLVENEPDFRRHSFVFTRGNWLTKGKEVQPGTPGSLPAFGKYPQNRLGLAQWLVSPENPLTARVAVNRFWEQLFGTGLVETAEDFGSQGSLPSHPELLDYLAVTFREDDHWQVKKLLKRLVMSATYQQRSEATAEGLQKDPSNRYLARGARVRLTAEQVRDQALAVSGLLSEKMFGKSVMPPQPEGVWKVVYSGETWQTSIGEDAFRRAVYTFWRRSSPYPSLMTFDAAGREVCQSRRIRTNTPLQALVTLNDTVYMTAARSLASKMLASGKTPEAQLRRGYQMVLFKDIQDRQLQALLNLYRTSEKYYSQKPAERLNLLGKSDAQQPDALARASLTLVANALLNLDEFVMKE